MCGSRLAVRGGGLPFMACAISPSPTSATEVSHCDRSIRCPSPVRARCMSAATTANAPCRPPFGSPYEKPTLIGRESGNPVSEAKPLIGTCAGPYDTYALSGPVAP